MAEVERVDPGLCGALQLSHNPIDANVDGGWPMPKLPSGLQLAISRHALFDHGGNWFSCPDGHFWFWVPGPEMGEPPYDLEVEIMAQAIHAPAPDSREDVKKYIRVLEMRSDGKYAWRGEWLSDFPQYTKLNERDLAAWTEWLSGPEIDQFLDATIEECRRLAAISKGAQGYAVFRGDSQERKSEPGGWTSGFHLLQRPEDCGT